MTRIAIIGAGVVGAAIAYELSLIKGLEITLLDEREPTSGSTGAALGVLMGVTSKRGWTIRKASLERYETLIPELESRTGNVIPYNRQGLVLLQLTQEETKKWDKMQKHRQPQGYNLERWNLDQLTQYCPHVAPENIVAAIYSPQDRQVNPTILTHSLIAAASLIGLKCQFGKSLELFSSPSSLNQDKAHLNWIQTSQGSFAIDYVVITAGIGSAQVTQSLKQAVDIRPVLGQALHLQLAQPLGNPDFQPVVTGNDIQIVPLGAGEYWIGATVEFPSEKGEMREDANLLEMVRQQAITFCPELAQAKVIRSWSGKRPRPEAESAPIIRELQGYDNVLLATGHFSNGVLLAPGTALIIKDKLLSLIS